MDMVVMSLAPVLRVVGAADLLWHLWHLVPPSSRCVIVKLSIGDDGDNDKCDVHICTRSQGYALVLQPLIIVGG